MKINDEVVYKHERYILTDMHANICVLTDPNTNLSVTASSEYVYKYVPIENFDITPYMNNNFYYDGNKYGSRSVIDTSQGGYLTLNINIPRKIYLNDPNLEMPNYTFKKNDTVIVNYLYSCGIFGDGLLTYIKSKNLGSLNIQSQYRKDAKLYIDRSIGKVVKSDEIHTFVKFSDGEELCYPSIMVKLIKARKVKLKTFNPENKYMTKSGKIVQIIENMMVTSIPFVKVKVVDSGEHMNIKIRDLKLIK